MLPLYLERPHRLVSGGQFLSDEAWTHVERVIAEYELIIGIAGVVFMEVDGVIYEIQAGDILILQPGERHRGYRLSLPGVSFYWFHFYLPEPADGGTPEGYIPRYAACPHPSRVHILARQLLHVANGGYRMTRAGDYFLTCLLVELAEQLEGTGKESTFDPQLSHLLEWTRIHALDEDISVERIAKVMGYNKEYLSRMFKRRFGLGLLSYIHKLKLEAAKEILSCTTQPLKQVADAVGINDDKQFIKWFKKLAGVTPTEYRRAFNMTRLNKE